MRRWAALALLLLIAAWLQFKLWRGDGGLGQARALQARVAEQRQENVRLQQRNDALGAEVEDLKSGEAAIEDRARSELGMVKPGEVFYRVVDPAADRPGDGTGPRFDDAADAGASDAAGRGDAGGTVDAAAPGPDATDATPDADAAATPARPGAPR